MGSDRAYLQPNDMSAGFSAITKATSIIVNRLAASPWSLTGRLPNEAPRWLADPMLTRPDDRYGAGVWPMPLRLPAAYFWGQWIRSALLWGMGWLIFSEDQQDQPWPGSMFLLNPWAVDCSEWSGLRAITNTAGGRVQVGPDGRFTSENGTRWRLFELKNPILPIDTATGTTPGVLAYHAAELGLQAAITQYTAGIYSGGGVPSGYLKVNQTKIPQGAADDLKASWMTAHGAGQRSVAVLNSLTDYKAISVSPVDAALADMTKLSLVSVANAFGVPMWMLGAPSGDSRVYSNVQMETEALWTHTLFPWARAIEDTLSALLPGDTQLTISMPGKDANE